MIYEIPGPPIPWKRPRLSGKRFFDSQATQKKEIQHIIQSIAESHLVDAPALKVNIEYHMPIPKSWSRIKRLTSIGKPHVSRPDLSNLIKFTEDALNGVVWKDDAVIYELHCRKVYSDEPHTKFVVEPLRLFTMKCLMGRHLDWPRI